MSTSETPEFAPTPAPTPALASGTQWSEPRRLHPLSFLVGLLREARRLVYLAVLVVLGRSIGSGGIEAVVITTAIAVSGIVVWLTTTFRVTDEELRIDSGIIARNHRTARFDRIQAVDLDQPLVARALGLAELRIQIAGGRRGHFRLACLRQAEAAQLRAYLLERCAEVAAHAPHAPLTPHAAPLTADGLPAGIAGTPGPDAALAYAPAGVAGPVDSPDGQQQPGPAPQNPQAQGAQPSGPQTAGAWQPPPPGWRPPTAYLGGVPYGHTADERPAVAVPTGMFIGSLALSPPFILSLFLLADAAVAVAFGGAAFVGSVAAPLAAIGSYAYNRFARYFGFTLTLSADGVRLRHGLTNRFAQTIPAARIQAIEICEPLLWRKPGWARARMNVAGYAHGGGEGEAGQRNVSYLLPVAPREVVWQLASYLVGTDLKAVPLVEAPRRAVLRSGPWRRGHAFGRNPVIVVARHGLFGRVYTVMRHEKAQSVRYRQGPWQRLLRLATVKVHSTRGPVRPFARNCDAAALEAFFVEQARLAVATSLPMRAAVAVDPGVQPAHAVPRGG